MLSFAITGLVVVLVVRMLGEMAAALPAVGGLGKREQLLISEWLTGLRSARTRRAYAGDLVAWLAWLGARGTDAFGAGRSGTPVSGLSVARWPIGWRSR